jgi:hypothetical protein
MFSAFPPLISVAKLCYLRRLDLLHFLRRLPRSFLAEVVFLLAGKVLDPPIRDSRLPFDPVSYPEKPTPSRPHDRTVTRVRLTRRSSLLPELSYMVLRGGNGSKDIESRAGSLG